MAIQSLDRAPRSNSGGGSTERVVIQVTGYDFVNDDGTPHPDDAVIGVLQRDACGLEAVSETVDADGNAVSAYDKTVRVQLRETKFQPSNPKRGRPTLHEVRDGKGTSKPCPEGAILSFDGTYAKGDKNGVPILHANWPNRDYPVMDTNLHRPFYGALTTVYPERTVKGEKGERQSQRVVVAMADYAAVVTSREQMIEEIRQIEALTEEMAGTPGFTLRVFDASGDDVKQTSFTRPYFKDEKRSATPEETFEAFANSAYDADGVEKDEDFVMGTAYMAELDVKAGGGHEGVTFEIVPNFTLYYGSESIPSARRADAESNGKTVKEGQFDEAPRYGMPTTREDGSLGRCPVYVASDVLTRRAFKNGEYTGDIVTGVRQAKFGAPAFEPGQYPTHNMSEEARAKLLAKGMENTQAMRPERKEEAKVDEPEAAVAGVKPL